MARIRQRLGAKVEVHGLVLNVEEVEELEEQDEELEGESGEVEDELSISSHDSQIASAVQSKKVSLPPDTPRLALSPVKSSPVANQPIDIPEADIFQGLHILWLTDIHSKGIMIKAISQALA